MSKAEISRELVNWAKTVFFALILAVLLNKLVIVNAHVDSGSMENTIMTNDRVAGLRLEFLAGGPKRYDIVVFNPPDGGPTPYVKRVIGLPGETVNIRDGKVYITDENGAEDPVPLDDSFTPETPTGDWGPFAVPEGCYFMLGDNRNVSLDSRMWVNSYVPRNNILGRVLIKYYPGVKLLNGY